VPVPRAARIDREAMTAAAGWGLRPAAALTRVRSSPTAHLRLRWVSACRGRAEPATCSFHQCGLAPRPREGRSPHTEAISFSSEDDPAQLQVSEVGAW